MMAAIDFPSNPNSGDQFVVGTITWTYDGAKWTAYPGVLSVPDAPSDGQLYGRKLVASTMSWTPVGSGDTDAPIDNSLYGRKNRGWIHPTHLDITDWAATLAPYALTANVPGATSTLPKMDGTATIGATGKWADGDHVHPTDTSRYAANNPSGYQTAAQVTASLASYLPLAGGTLTGALTLAADPGAALGAATKQYVDNKASSTAPAMDGTAAVGTGTTWARADHVHPSDTSRLAISGGTISGALTVNTALNAPNWRYSGDVTFSLYAAASERYLQYAASWFLGWNTTTGRLRWVGGTGPIELFSIDAVGNVIANGSIQSTAGVINSYSGGAGNVSYNVYTGATLRGQVIWQAATGYMILRNSLAGATSSIWCDQGAGFFCATDTAYKPSGGAWTASSDARIKTVIDDYALGLDEVLQLKPVHYVYKGNDTPTADVNENVRNLDEPKPRATAAPYPASLHYNVAKDQKQYVGFIAQDVESVFPDMITQREGYIDGEKVSDVRNIDTSELIYALVNCVKTLAARVAELEAAQP